MAIPEGYTKLGLVGYSDKGTYTAEATYNRYNVVLYNGSTYVALKDGLTGVEPSDDKVNWKYFARGFEAEDAAEIEVTDTYGVTDEEPTSAGGLTKKTILQTWLDKVADRIINKLVANDNFQTKLMQFLVNNGTTNLEGFGLDARFGKTLQDQISELNAKANASITIENNTDFLSLDSGMYRYSTWSSDTPSTSPIYNTQGAMMLVKTSSAAYVTCISEVGKIYMFTYTDTEGRKNQYVLTGQTLS